MSMEVKNTPLVRKTRDSSKKCVVNVGGAGSSKSYSIAQLLIAKLINEDNKRIGICRKTFPALRMTAMALTLDLLKQYGIYNPSRHNKTANTYTYRNTVIQFFSLDEWTRIKSANFNYIWMEEANEFTFDDYIALKLCLRNPTLEDEPNHMYLSLNPIDENNWIAKKLQYEEDVEIIHSTYKDNPFLDEDYRKVLHQLINEDENYYRIYVLGEWGKLENLIYTNYEVVDSLPKEYQVMAYGLDFGYVNPTALIKVCMVDRDIYLDERIYRAHITNSDLIQMLSNEDRGDIYADSAEPDRIEEISRAGYNVYPAMKDVQLGIDLCKRQKLYITKDSVNLLKEIRGYQRKVDKAGVVLEEPVKFNDHLMDGMRYVIYGLTDRFGFATATPGGSRITEIHRFD